MQKIKINDPVKIILGKSKGKTGTVKKILHKKHKIIINGINKKIKHLKPKNSYEKGKIIFFYAPIDSSNISISKTI